MNEDDSGLVLVLPVLHGDRVGGLCRRRGRPGGQGIEPARPETRLAPASCSGTAACRWPPPVTATSRWPAPGRPTAAVPTRAPSAAAWSSRPKAGPVLPSARRGPRCKAQSARWHGAGAVAAPAKRGMSRTNRLIAVPPFSVCGISIVASTTSPQICAGVQRTAYAATWPDT